MNWKRAIEINRENLASIVAGLAAMLRAYAPGFGFEGDKTPPETASPLRGGTRSERSDADRVGVSAPDEPHARSPSGSEPDCVPPPETGELRSPFRPPLKGEVGVLRLPPPTYRQILNILRPAEAALRRLIVVVASILNIRVAAARARIKGQPLPDFSSFIRKALPQFPLIDPRKSFAPEQEQQWVQPSGIPRISIPGIFDPVFETRSYDDVDGTSIIRRIQALDHALKTLPKQAKRLARLMSKRDAAKPGRGRVGPIRPGKPPGYRQRHLHAVDDILDECHWLVREVEAVPP